MDAGLLHELVKAHQSEIYRYLRYLGSASDVAEDLVQETFLASLRSGSYPDMTNVRLRAAWIRGVARNTFLNHCRSTRKQPLNMDTGTLKRAEQTWQREFLREGDGFDTIEALRGCLEKMPSAQRRIVNLRYAERRSRTSMAGMLKMSADGVKSSLRRIREALANCVERRLRSEAP